MKRILLLVCSFFLACNVYAAELKVGVVNMDQVLQKSPLAMQLNQKISTDFKPRQDAFNAAQLKLQDAANQLAFTGFKMTTEERNAAQAKVNAQRQDLEKMSASLQQDLAAAQSQGSQALLAKLNTVIQKIAKDGSYDMILTTANILYLNTTIDITTSVIDQLK